jgi:hypothetical protein
MVKGRRKDRTKEVKVAKKERKEGKMVKKGSWRKEDEGRMMKRGWRRKEDRKATTNEVLPALPEPGLLVMLPALSVEWTIQRDLSQRFGDFCHGGKI